MSSNDKNWIVFLEKTWKKIRKIIVQILSFTNHILKFFKNPDRLKKLQEDRNKLAISIKEKLDNGEYRVVNCLFDRLEEDIIDFEDEAIGIAAEELDQQTENLFGDREMVIIQ